MNKLVFLAYVVVTVVVSEVQFGKLAVSAYLSIFGRSFYCCSFVLVSVGGGVEVEGERRGVSDRYR